MSPYRCENFPQPMEVCHAWRRKYKQAPPGLENRRPPSPPDEKRHVDRRTSVPGLCWVCGDRNHIARNCTNRHQGNSPRLVAVSRENGRRMPRPDIHIRVSPNTISIRIGSRICRALIDTGADVSVVHSKVFKSIKPRPDLISKSIKLQTANGSRLKFKGETSLEFKVGEQRSRYDFFVVENLKRNVILGRDWLKKNQVGIYYDLDALRFKGEYVALEEDKHIPSLVRLQSTLVLKPQHAYTC